MGWLRDRLRAWLVPELNGIVVRHALEDEAERVAQAISDTIKRVMYSRPDDAPGTIETTAAQIKPPFNVDDFARRASSQES